MTQLTKDTPVPVLWVWMLIAGLGVGTTFSVPTIVIQNAVPFKELGVATSNLTFFRQIGGTIALAFVGTIFGSAFADQLVPQLLANGVPQPLISGMQSAGAGFDIGQLTGVGDLATNLAAIIPPQFQSFIPNIIEGIHAAFSLATAQTFWLGVAGSIVAALAAVAIKEIPLRSANSAPVPAAEQGGIGAPVATTTKTDVPAPKLPATE